MLPVGKVANLEEGGFHQKSRLTGLAVLQFHLVEQMKGSQKEAGIASQRLLMKFFFEFGPWPLRGSVGGPPFPEPTEWDRSPWLSGSRVFGG
jgi:hypothetical protein